MQISDKLGLTKRPGISLLGSFANDTTPVTGIYNFIKAGGNVELPTRAKGTVSEYFHPQLLDWERLESGFTSGSEMGFKEHNVNTDNEDYEYMCNRTESYRRWPGAVTQLNGALVGGESTVTVDGVFKDQVLYSGTAGGVGTTVIVPNTTTGSFIWATDAWNTFYVLITSGAQSGKIGLISDTGTYDLSGANSATFTADFTTDFITNNTHGRSNGDVITVSNSGGALPAGLTANTPYYVINKTANTFQVSLTAGGVAVDITDNGTGTQTYAVKDFITFASIAGLSGTPTYEIRQAAFPATGTLVIGTEELAYTALASGTSFTTSAVVSAHADNSAVTIKPTAYPTAPKGNRLENYLTRMAVGRVISAVGIDSTGTTQGSALGSSAYISELGNATNFALTSSRVAGDPDVIALVYGGGDISDVFMQEKTLYIAKEDYIESDSYSQDQNDIVTRDPLKSGYGVVGRVIKGKNDVFFVTKNNEITSLGRVALKDITPQSLNIGIVIKRLLDTYDFSMVRGIEFKNKLYFAFKDSSDDSANNRVLVYNVENRSFEGIWYLNASGFMQYSGGCYFGSSLTGNTYQMFSGVNDVIDGTTEFSITSQWQSNWMNLTPKKRFTAHSDQKLQSVNAYGAEGYITPNTILTFNLYADFASDPALTFTFSGTEDDFTQGANLTSFLGDNPLGLELSGSISEPNEDGIYHFQFITYFPDIYSNHFSLGVENDGTNQFFDITRLSIDLLGDPLEETTNIFTP